MPRVTFAAVIAGGALVAIFGALLLRFRTELRADIQEKIIGRDATVLYPVALQQLAENETNAGTGAVRPSLLLSAVLRSAQQQGMLAVAIFDADGETLQTVPARLLFVELPVDDYLKLLEGKPISRYHPTFPVRETFAGVSAGPPTAPVLEVLLPLHGLDPGKRIGFARYYLDARPLAAQLAAIDERINRQTATTLVLGTGLIAGVIVLATTALRRAQRAVAQRNEQLTKANFDLTLAAKASALGQIASHLIHGLQGPVAGLRATMADHHSAPDWQSAADYTERLQSMIQETVALLGDTSTQASYELTGRELAAIIRERNASAARMREVRLSVNEGFAASLDSHRGSILCLIANNLVQNALAASARDGTVTVALNCEADTVRLTVSDEGGGIPEDVRAHLFEPGRSGRAGGSGLGLAISQLLARQIAADLSLVHTGEEGTAFCLTLALLSPAERTG